MKAIEYQHVSMGYDTKEVVKDFHLSIEQGEFVTIIGSSGCGKTTILKMVNALIQQKEGIVLVHGKDVQKEDITMLRRSIGYAIQGNVLFPHMSIEQNIAYVPNLCNTHDKKRTDHAVTKWMRIVGLDDELRHRYPSQLSGGQQQRVGIARALAASPDILLMDEPFGAVDEITRFALQDEIKRIHAETGITILFVTHDIREALTLGSKVLVMDQGKLQQYDTPHQVRNKPGSAFVAQLLQHLA